MDIEGVQNVEGDLENKKVTIDYSDPADEEKLRSLLSEIHYPPK
jgi:copper chaperone CopZ